MRTAFELAGYLFVFVVFALGTSISVYGVVSFALMRPYTTSRTLGVSIRELARESILAALTQPFLPLYYVIGRRMEPLLFRSPANVVKASGTPVVFVHGYMQNRVCFLGLARAFTRKGIGPLYGINYPWFVSIDSNAKRLERFIARVCEETGSPSVDLVCHSMGGLVAMEMMRIAPPEAQLKVRRCVTIATPHAGVAWRGPLIGFGATSLRRGSELLALHATTQLKVPTLSVFSSHDNVVHPKETSHLAKRGGRDIEVAGLAHLSILFAPAVAEHASAFLLDPLPDAVSSAVVSPPATFEAQSPLSHAG